VLAVLAALLTPSLVTAGPAAAASGAVPRAAGCDARDKVVDRATLRVRGAVVGAAYLARHTGDADLDPGFCAWFVPVAKHRGNAGATFKIAMRLSDPAGSPVTNGAYVGSFPLWRTGSKGAYCSCATSGTTAKVTVTVRLGGASGKARLTGRIR
jgi:hypothetical protein